MAPYRRVVTILMAEDDEDDRELARQAMGQGRLTSEFRFVEDGEELLDYLLRRGRYADPKSAPRPALILLDLNMPRLDGREALRALKSHPALRQIPVIVLTTSKAEEDILRSYDLGANCYISKPGTFEGFGELMKVLDEHWLQLATLPHAVAFHED
jgi:CheY-like chemotaxis protein